MKKKKAEKERIKREMETKKNLVLRNVCHYIKMKQRRVEKGFLSRRHCFIKFSIKTGSFVFTDKVIRSESEIRWCSCATETGD